MPRSELLEVSRSCYHTVLARVSTLLTGLRVVPTAPPVTDGAVVSAIPMSLPGSKLFAVLPHLLCPGMPTVTWFSQSDAYCSSCLRPKPRASWRMMYRTHVGTSPQKAAFVSTNANLRPSRPGIGYTVMMPVRQGR